MTNAEKTKELLLELNYNEIVLNTMLSERKFMISKDFEEEMEQEMEHLKSKSDSLILQREEIIKQIPSYNEETYREYKRVFILDNEIKETEKTHHSLEEYYKNSLNVIENEIKAQEEKIEDLRNIIYGNGMK